MKLLIITQVVNERDPILGFFCRWIEEFAKRLEFVTVIGLEVGEYHLPTNVKVLSLGKEKKLGRLKYLLNFYRFTWREKDNYDTVFVHMNQEYILLAGWWWRLIGKKVWLWRNHPYGNWLTVITVWLASRVFCTSLQSFTARFAKTEIMPAGIDTDLFKPNPSIKRKPHSILFLGRIAPIKRVEIFIEALRILKDRGCQFNATIVGDALVRDREYFDSLVERSQSYGLTGWVRFIPAVPNKQTVELYNQNQLYVNCTSSGSLDKTIFEAMACDCVALVSNRSFTTIFPSWLWGCLMFSEDNSNDLASKIDNLLKPYPDHQQIITDSLRAIVANDHSLQSLARKLIKVTIT